MNSAIIRVFNAIAGTTCTSTDRPVACVYRLGKLAMGFRVGVGERPDRQGPRTAPPDGMAAGRRR